MAAFGSTAARPATQVTNGRFSSKANQFQVRLAELLGTSPTFEGHESYGGGSDASDLNAGRLKQVLRLLEEMCGDLGAYSPLVRAVAAELERAIFSNHVTASGDSHEIQKVAYFSLVGKIEQQRAAAQASADTLAAQRDALALRLSDMQVDMDAMQSQLNAQRVQLDANAEVHEDLLEDRDTRVAAVSRERDKERASVSRLLAERDGWRNQVKLREKDLEDVGAVRTTALHLRNSFATLEANRTSRGRMVAAPPAVVEAAARRRIASCAPGASRAKAEEEWAREKKDMAGALSGQCSELLEAQHLLRQSMSLQDIRITEYEQSLLDPANSHQLAFEKLELDFTRNKILRFELLLR